MKAKADLITGFLGAGKTTFLRQYTSYLRERGITFAVIENEFGAAGVDTAVLREEACSVKELSGGCICCTLKVGFHDMILELSHEVERILIEPSGIFSPKDFWEVVLSPDIKAVCEVGFIAAILDPGIFPKLGEIERGVLGEELSSAGQILLSHRKNYSPQYLEDFEAGLENFSIDITGSRQFCEKLDPADCERLSPQDFERFMQTAPPQLGVDFEKADHSALFQSTVLYPEDSFTKERLESILQTVSKGEMGEILRVKGFVKAKDSGMAAVNYTPSFHTVEFIPSQNEPMLNIIGRKLRRKQLKSLFTM